MKRRVLKMTFGVVTLFSVVVGASMIDALRQDTGESVSGKLAAWARRWHLGSVVDTVERFHYRTPPSATPAQDLGVEDAAPSSPAPAVTTTTVVPQYAPAPITAVLSPALKGEGVWSVVARSNGQPAVWTTGLRPSKRYGSVRASFAVIDQTYLRAALFNGSELPGGKWQRGNKVPASLTPVIRFAFNGGFRREHAQGGYLTEGKTAWPLKVGAASLALDADGQLHVGVWGRDFTSAGWGGRPWASVRQNLTLLLDDGKLFDAKKVWVWGASGKGELYILRSAVCERTDGKLLYAIVGDVDALGLAEALQLAGCRTAMQLDVNASYPRAYSFKGGVPKRLDRRMAGKDDLYLTKSYREFFALFDTGALTQTQLRYLTTP